MVLSPSLSRLWLDFHQTLLELLRSTKTTRLNICSWTKVKIINGSLGDVTAYVTISFLVHEYCSYLFIYGRLKLYVWMKTPLPDRVQMNILYFDIAGFDNHDGSHKPKFGLWQV